MKTTVQTPRAARDQSIQYLKGIGPVRAKALAGLGVHTVRDLLFYVPRRYLDRSEVVTISRLREIAAGNSVRERGDALRFYTVLAEVRSFQTVGFRQKSRFVLVVTDQTGSMQCVWFGGVQYWKTRFRLGDTLALSGSPTFYGRILQFVHPEIDRISGRSDETEPDDIDLTKLMNTGGLIPIYPSTAELDRVGLHSGGLRRVIQGLLANMPAIPDYLPNSLLQMRDLLPLPVALRQVHRPDSRSALGKALGRLKYEELFFFQLLLARQRHRMKEEAAGISFSVKSRLARQMVDSLPFKLTGAQVRVINEITRDMESKHPLNRLLQGDVGSGKTVVALVAMLIAVENGYQTVFMAPTELLAEQHYRTITSVLNGIEVNVRLLVGKQRSRLRRDILEDIRRGSAGIVVGTHALFEQAVDFAKLGLVVIDEQHRFGVMQRAKLMEKGESPDVLVMTATPIPRTLSLTLYGDLDVSVIDEMPRNRKPVETMIRHEAEKEWVYRFTRDEVRKGRQAYYVYPVIKESEKTDLKAASVHFDYLRTRIFPRLRLGLLHGRLPSEEKELVMTSFVRGDIDILVATTVIEVGIDVPNASLMVIENAERFGLSQLHQLRGRVGRGAEKSYCILLTGKLQKKRQNGLFSADEQMRLSEKRLQILATYTDGFRISEADLQIRGPGDFFGTRQSGMPLFRVADLLTDGSILDEARADAFHLVEEDPLLTHPEHMMLAHHLERYFEQVSLLLGTA
jgi:ATP-dependent DNA helicase RecG